jgi:hypothetical protein
VEKSLVAEKNGSENGMGIGRIEVGCNSNGLFGFL